MSISVILHDIRSAYNVGSIFRTADGAGVSKIYLTGHAPTPGDRFGRTQTEVQKTSLGAADTVPWEYRDDILMLIEELKNEGCVVVAVEQHKRAQPYDQVTAPQNAVYIFGNEVAGLSDKILSSATQIVDIPMHGKKESLNVSIAAGIVLFNIRQHR